MTLFNNNQILERLYFENPWWSIGSIDPTYQKMKERTYFKSLP